MSLPSPYVFPALSKTAARKYVKKYVKKPQIRKIINSVCEATGIEYKRIMSDERTSPVVAARYMCWNLIMEYHKDISYKQIGRLFKKHHSTVIYSLSSFPANLLYDPLVRKQFSKAKKIIHAKTKL